MYSAFYITSIISCKYIIVIIVLIYDKDLMGMKVGKKEYLSVESCKFIVCRLPSLVARINFLFSIAECFGEKRKSE